MLRLLTFGSTLGLILTACAESDRPEADSCAGAAMIGQFDPSIDLFLAHFDIKTDVDDLHSAAAVATFLGTDDFRCVSYIAVAGTYGTQGGEYVPGKDLFAEAFGPNWRDAHNNREIALEDVADRVSETLEAGGEVWVMEGGQSDFTHDMLMAVRTSGTLLLKDDVHVVQHSDWNESVTTEEKLSAVKAMTDYRKIADGNGPGNGTPNYNTQDASLWSFPLASERVGGIWQMAKEQGEAWNGVGYENPTVTQGGLDFSDTVEAAHIFGFQDQENAADFFADFLP
ncbi:hypothetical protein HK107_06030 [Parvularcula sp. ZS-1/3]|uniref:Uncharacterized protein n=1 Tax=Parvularcula mediterranea TaxID=2732508 RepID=A0A7Y3W4T3_9PROT|nr:hypothetical protein [Parvularcula mediterranea]NNU15879.1 hypothetical protein [Parvularcula mediterranea]